ncbi:MAG: hypothetical protein ACP5GJ_03415 [Nanopusillaceae archaeon]
MRTFNYLIEIILVISLILVYFTTLKFPSSPSSYINSFNKKYILYSGLGSTYNNEFLSYLQTNQFDVLSYLYYWMFSGEFSSYYLKMSFYYPINFYNLGNYSCYEFLFPFPNLEGIYYTQQVQNVYENFFFVYNKNYDICANFSSSLDWYEVLVNVYNSSNISLFLNISNMINQTIDPYSFFAYDINSYPISIGYLNISYIITNSGTIPIVNISFNLPPGYSSSIIILFRAENITYNYLNFDNYQLVNNLPAQQVSFSFSPFSWETLYVYSQCFDNSNVISFTSYNQFFNLTNSSYYPPQLSGNVPITVAAWIYINSYNSSSCWGGENYISTLHHTSNVPDYKGSTFRQIILPNNSQYYLGIDESNGVGYLPNYTLPLNQWIFVFWEYNNTNGQFYGGFINQTGLYYGQIIGYDGWQLGPLNLYSAPNETIYLGSHPISYPPECTFLGDIYVIAFYNKDLSLNQLENIYYTGDFEQYDPVVIYYGKNYNPSTGILYSSNQNYNLQAYNNPQLYSSISPYDQLIVEYTIPPNYQDQIQSSNINISYCYPIPTYYSFELIPSNQYNFWSYFNVNPVPINYKYASSAVFPYGLGFSKFTVYGS